MEELGTIQTLCVSRMLPQGVYLETSSDDVLLPNAEVPEGVEEGSWLEVFIYCDSEDRMIATLRKPIALVGECKALEVIDVNPVGTFLRWGLQKDLLLPHGERKSRLLPGDRVVVRVVVDEETKRIIATEKLGRFLDKAPPRYLENQQVEVMVVQNLKLGYRVLVEGAHWGMIYHNEVFRDIRLGEKLNAYVLLVREDGKIDIALQKPGAEKVGTLEDRILETLNKRGGRLELGDKSPAEAVRSEFQVSKKTFKKALGALYKKGLVELSDERTVLVEK